MQRPDLSLFFPKHGLKAMDEKWNCSRQPPGEAIRVVWVELGLIEVTRNLYAGLLGRIIHLSYKVNSFLTTAVIGTEKLLFFFFFWINMCKRNMRGNFVLHHPGGGLQEVSVLNLCPAAATES